jgi:hypothetical protein
MTDQETKWEDISSYSRNQKVGEPNIWQLELQGVRVTIVRDHRHYDSWVATLNGRVQIDTFEIKSTDLQSAITETLDKVRSILSDTLSKI